MNKRRIISSAFYPILFYIAFIFFILPSAIAQKRSLPFTMSVTPMQIDNLPDYLTSKSPDEWMDFPVSTARIDGAFWVMFKNGETKPAFRYKGTNFEDGKREPDGKMFTNVSRPYILGVCGMIQLTKSFMRPYIAKPAATIPAFCVRFI